MVTNNALNITEAGLVSYDGAGVFSAGVAGGGTNYPSSGIAASGYYSIATSIAFINNLEVVDSRLYLVPFHHTDEVTTANVGITVGGAAAGSTVRIGLYSLAPATGALILVADWGTISTASTGIHTTSAVETLDVSTQYLYGITTDLNSGTVNLKASSNSIPLGFTGTNLIRHMYKESVSAGSSLPSSFAWGDLTSGSSGGFPVLIYN